MRKIISIITNTIGITLLYAFYILSYILGFLPLDAQLKICGVLSNLLPKYRKKVVLANLRLCFPEKSEQEIQACCKENAKYTLSLVPSLFFCFRNPEKACKYPHTVKGIEHIHSIFDEGKGCILLAPHSLVGVVPVTLLKNKYKLELFVVYRALQRVFAGKGGNNLLKKTYAIFEKTFDKIRQRVIKPIQDNDIKTMVCSLRKGGIVIYLIDGRHAKSMSGKVKFFGYEGDVLVNLHRLMKLGNAKLAYIHTQHTRGEYQIEIKAFDEKFYQASELEKMQIYMNHVEQTARAEPSQYLWQHKKFIDVINYDA